MSWRGAFLLAKNVQLILKKKSGIETEFRCEVV